MSIKRYVAEKDTTITNAFTQNLITRAVDANMGASDSLEMFSIFGQATSSSLEKSRILIQFPVSNISSDRNNSKIPQSGSCQFFLRVYNVKHPLSLPKNYNAVISALSQSWDEGYGLDMEGYLDRGWSAQKGGSGCTWEYATENTQWNTTGGAYFGEQQYNFPVHFETGEEDIELDVTSLVENWITGSIPNYGLVIKMSGSYEDGTQSTSFYTKKFSARGSEFFYKRPVIEVRWEALQVDDRNKFFRKSEALSLDDNKMNIYFYNKVNGSLKNIYNNIIPEVKFYEDSLFTKEISSSFKQISNPSSGIYKCQVILDTTSSVAYDKWYNTGSSGIYFSSSFDLLTRDNYDYNSDEEYIVNISNNKLKYSNSEIAKFKIFSRKRDWQPTIYTVAYNNVENSVLTDLYYKIFRLNDNYTVIDYSTGSLAYTKTSYDSNGNYFDLDMSLLEPGYTYGIKLAKWNGIELKEFLNTFKFKVD